MRKTNIARGKYYMRVVIALLCLLAPLLIGARAVSVPDYIDFYTSEAGDTGFNGVLTVYDSRGSEIGPIGGNFTVEVYGDRDYQDKMFDRSFEVPSSGWGIWRLNKKVPAWGMPRISYDDIGEDLPEGLYVRAIFRPTDTPEKELTDKTTVWR
ncbi:MAG: hypothetical protein LUQ38_00290 [Methanotrichaceae archaeon]|nr:hypothetical protein [Methanotrichaceae archaeon]